MQDEETTPTQTQEVEELEQSTSSAEEQPQAEVEQPEVEELPEVPADEPEEEAPVEEAPPSPRENKRIQQLTKKLAESSQQLEQFQSKPFSQPQEETQIIGEGDYDVNEINSRARQYGDNRYQEGLAQANSLQFATRLEIDTPRVAQKYPELDQNSDKFDPGSASFINELYLKSVGYNANTGAVANPNIRYEEFADGIMELRETLVAAKAVESQQNIAKQAAQTGVRPNSVAKKVYAGEDPSKMTTEQLESFINQSLGIK